MMPLSKSAAQPKEGRRLLLISAQSGRKFDLCEVAIGVRLRKPSAPVCAGQLPYQHCFIANFRWANESENYSVVACGRVHALPAA